MAKRPHPGGKAEESAKNRSDLSPFNAAELKLMKSFNLSPDEFHRYKDLDILTQTKITALLKERKHLNKYVTMHLGEKINANKQFTMLIQLLFPTEHTLRYALQKVNHIESEINAMLPINQPLFDKKTTQKNRLQILLTVAENHQKELKKIITSSDPKNILQRKLTNLNMIISEFKKQLQTEQFTIHDKNLKSITDTDLCYFLSKLKAIGISGLEAPSVSKNQSSFFKVHIISAMYERFYPTPSNEDDTTSPSNKPK